MSQKSAKSAAEEEIEVTCPMSDDSRDDGAHNSVDFFAVNGLGHEIKLLGLGICTTIAIRLHFQDDEDPFLPIS